MLVAVQLSVAGSSLAPVFKAAVTPLNPPQTIISLPVQTALWPSRAAGAFTIVVGVQLSVTQSKEENSGSLYISDVRALDPARAFAPSYAPRLLTSLSAKIGSARHSAMTNGSLPSASNSSPNTSGCLV